MLQSLMHIRTNSNGVISRRTFLRNVAIGAASAGLMSWKDAVALHADELRPFADFAKRDVDVLQILQRMAKRALSLPPCRADRRRDDRDNHEHRQPDDVVKADVE